MSNSIEVVNRKGEKFEVIVDSSFKAPSKIWVGSSSKGIYAFVRSNGESIQLHRYIMKLNKGVGMVDHINQNSLDNRRENLRLVSNQQNQANRKPQKGYHWSKIANKWKAQIWVNGKNLYLGYFQTEEEASKAYKIAHVEHFKEFSPYKEELYV